eukprot:scaffold17698_cov29-Prasinocladus_malaysianus.AAC.2
MYTVQSSSSRKTDRGDVAQSGVIASGFEEGLEWRADGDAAAVLSRLANKSPSVTIARASK